MARNYYSEINLHLVWHTKNSLPLLTPEIEPIAHRLLKKRIVESPNAFVHEIGGIETHVHVVVTIQPTLLISEFIGRLKGGSSHDVNQAMGRGHKVLEWQNGYGVVSFGTRDLLWVIEYVRNQRERSPRPMPDPTTNHAWIQHPFFGRLSEDEEIGRELANR